MKCRGKCQWNGFQCSVHLCKHLMTAQKQFWNRTIPVCKIKSLHSASHRIERKHARISWFNHFECVSNDLKHSLLPPNMLQLATNADSHEGLLEKSIQWSIIGLRKPTNSSYVLQFLQMISDFFCAVCCRAFICANRIDSNVKNNNNRKMTLIIKMHSAMKCSTKNAIMQSSIMTIIRMNVASILDFDPFGHSLLVQQNRSFLSWFPARHFIQ